MSVLRTVVKGCGGYLPERVLTNDDLAKVVDTTDDWIADAHRHQGAAHRRPRASSPRPWGPPRRARRSTTRGSTPEDIDLIILATSTPDQTFPATAVTIQADLGITHGAAFDVQAVCSGFVFALTTADNYLKSGAIQAGAGDRLRGLLPHPRLGRPLAPACCSATAPARVVVEAADAERRTDRPRRARDLPALRRPLSRQALCRRRAVHRPARSAMSAWTAPRSSAMRSPISPR